MKEEHFTMPLHAITSNQLAVAVPFEAPMLAIANFEHYRITAEKLVPASKVVVKVGEAPVDDLNIGSKEKLKQLFDEFSASSGSNITFRCAGDLNTLALRSFLVCSASSRISCIHMKRL